jgi:hypothetical protein
MKNYITKIQFVQIICSRILRSDTLFQIPTGDTESKENQFKTLNHCQKMRNAERIQKILTSVSNSFKMFFGRIRITTMFFNEYSKASKRHLQACEVLLGNLKDHSTCKKEHILQETYYLTGYIFECIYKYALFVLIGYDPQKPVEELNENRLSYKQHIKTHNLKMLTCELNMRISGNIPFIKHKDGIDNSTLKLYKTWNPRFRYTAFEGIDEGGIISLFDWSKKTREKILENI